jgi:hypothetical protein
MTESAHDIGMKIKIFSQLYGDSDDLETEVNEFLEIVNVVDVKFTEAMIWDHKPNKVTEVIQYTSPTMRNRYVPVSLIVHYE